MCKRNVLTIVTVAILALAIGQVQAVTVTVPNSSFELFYKPGTDVLGVVSDDGWTLGVGPACPIDNGQYVFDDGTTGDVADIPGWLGYDRQGWIDNGGTYGRDETTGNFQGAVTPQGGPQHDGLHCFNSNGGGYGNAAGGLIVSDASLGNVKPGIYTLSMYVKNAQGDPALPRVLDLLADGVVVTPTSSVDPTPSADWQEYTRTYDFTKLTSYVGQAITIVLGVGREATGAQSHFDSVSLSYEHVLQASEPIPADEATEVLRDVVLNWTPGEFAAAVNGHTVYLSESFDDVNDGIGGITQSAASYVPDQRLEFGTTYYWRVDEVNAPPDSTVYPGGVWSFTTELLAYPIENVTAMASSSNVDEGAENTVNGSGVDANDLHSTETTNMWRSSPDGDGPAWIEYEFDRVSKLHEMWVWNHNSSLEQIYGFGFKDVSIEYSVDGIDYKALGTTHEFAQAPGTLDYAHETIDFAGAAVKYVRLTANSTWGSVLSGLSEVRFFRIPVHAREPYPDSGATDVDLDVVLGWKAGREAVSHDVYVSADPNALIFAGPVTEPAYDTASLDLALGQTYHWRIDEVNDAETTTTWQGDIWSFSTPEYLVVDDFESYNDLNPDDPESNRIFLTWIGGDDDPANGSQVGHDMYPFAELTIVHGGNQSMPLFYNNSIASYSEATVNTDDLAIGRDWTKGAPETLILWIHGDPNNAATEQLYVKIGDTRFDYTGDAAELTRPIWSQWPIDLAGIDLSNVPTFSIGFERTGAGGGAGIVYIDDIALYPQQSVSPIGITITVPNGDFEEIYKPGSDTVTADLSGGWTQGLGPDAPMDDGTATYSDGTTGDLVDIPGWIGADAQGWIDNGGTYDRDTNFPNRQGAVAAQIVTPDGLYYYLSNGGGWGNSAGGLIVSDASLGNVEGGTYTLSILATGPDGAATPVVLELLADGVALTPSSSVDPELSADWQEFSRTYDAVSLDGHLGESLTILLGVGRGSSGGQSCFDAVSLSYVP